MRIIQRYLAGNLLWTSLLALFVLVSLFSFFTLIDQLEDTGRGTYGITEAVIYTLLTMPRISYELFPIAAVIGSMAVLGILARNNELDVILTSGISRFSLSLVLIKSSFLLVIVALIIGELIAPIAEEKAQNIRSLALSENITLKTRYGFWIRDGNSYVNIRRMLPGNQIQDIYFYEFDNDNNLRSSFHAENATYNDGKWIMEDIRESLLSDNKVESRTVNQAIWESLINPEILNVVTVKPQYLSMLGLANYITYLKQNAQNSLSYEQALWSKLMKPFSIVAMIVLAVPLVSGPSRTVAVGQRVFTGALAGIIFHIFTQVSENLGVVYQFHPAVSVIAPILLLVTIIIYLMRS
jgi:lipopolysaccharide export system permease protein